VGVVCVFLACDPHPDRFAIRPPLFKGRRDGASRSVSFSPIRMSDNHPHSRGRKTPRGVKRSRPRKPGARGTPGSRTRRQAPPGPADPGTSRHRGLPKSYEPQVRRSPGVPRAMFEVCSARPPVGLPFQTEPPPTHRCGARQSRWRSVPPKQTALPPRPQWRAAGAPGPRGLDLRRAMCVRHRQPATAPSPTSRGALETPPVGTG
jgi:hypothetical protein